MAEHVHLHDAPWAQLDAEFAAEGKDGKWIVKAMDRKLALEAAGGPIREGYLVAVVRQKTRRPDLKLSPAVSTFLRPFSKSTARACVVGEGARSRKHESASATKKGKGRRLKAGLGKRSGGSGRTASARKKKGRGAPPPCQVLREKVVVHTLA